MSTGVVILSPHNYLQDDVNNIARNWTNDFVYQWRKDNQ